jgi:hypothetical protein
LKLFDRVDFNVSSEGLRDFDRFFSTDVVFFAVVAFFGCFLAELMLE